MHLMFNVRVLSQNSSVIIAYFSFIIVWTPAAADAEMPHRSSTFGLLITMEPCYLFCPAVNIITIIISIFSLFVCYIVLSIIIYHYSVFTIGFNIYAVCL